MHETQIASPFDPPEEPTARNPMGGHQVEDHQVGGSPVSGAHAAVRPHSPGVFVIGGGPPSGAHAAIGPTGAPIIGGGPPSGRHPAVSPTSPWPTLGAPAAAGAQPQSAAGHPHSLGSYPPISDRHTHKTAVGPPSGALPAVQEDIRSGLGATATGSDSGPAPSRGLPRIGEMFNGYKVVELLGQGNMGRIYRIRDQLGRDLALKVILGQVASSEGLARFEREGQAMAAIPRHKHVIGVHSAGTAGTLPYLVLDFVEGENLDEVLRRGPLPAAQAALVCEKLSRALDHVHQSGVLHRDLKPANVLIRASDGEPLLTDFGLAGLQGADTLTRTGDVIGTPLYMAPEQLLGLHREVDGRADVWSLGVMLFEMATGSLPFPGTTMLEVTDAVLSANPPRLHERCADADPALNRILILALAKDKEDRLPSPGALAAALRAWRKQRQGYDVELDLPPPPRMRRDWRRRKVLIGSAAAIGVTLLGSLAVVIATKTGQGDATPTATATASETPARTTLSAEASTALEAVEAASQSQRGVRAFERALRSPHLKDLPPTGRVRLRSVGLMALSEINLELQRTAPRPHRVAGFLRAAGQSQRLSGSKLPGGVNVDGILNWILNRQDNQAKPLDDPNWLQVFDAIRMSGFRPTQSCGGKFLDDISFAQDARKRRDYVRILTNLVAVGVPTFYSQFDLRRPPERPLSDDSVALYVYHQTVQTYYRKQNETRRNEARAKIGDLVRNHPEDFDPRTLALALNASVHRGKEYIDADIEGLEKVLGEAPDAFYGWDGLIFLYLKKAEVRAHAKDRAGVDECYQLGLRAIERGRRALRANSPGTRSTTEAMALTSLLRRQVEFLQSYGMGDGGLGERITSDRKRRADLEGRERYKRIQAYLKGS